MASSRVVNIRFGDLPPSSTTYPILSVDVMGLGENVVVDFLPSDPGLYADLYQDVYS